MTGAERYDKTISGCLNIKHGGLLGLFAFFAATARRYCAECYQKHSDAFDYAQPALSPSCLPTLNRPMLTGDLKSKIDQIWNAFWSGGIANPIEVIEQIT